jgi:hypothetical protein
MSTLRKKCILSKYPTLKLQELVKEDIESKISNKEDITKARAEMNEIDSRKK